MTIVQRIVWLLIALAAIANVNAQESPLPELSWVPPEDGFDWIQLKSGEWLKGRIKAMQERELEFDSDELEDLSFDWKDIRQVRSGSSMEVKLISGQLLVGRVFVTPSDVRVAGTGGETVPRALLQSFTRSGAREIELWSGKVSLGLTMRNGNTEQTDYNGNAHLQRRTPITRLTLDYIAFDSATSDVETADDTRVSGSFDYWLTSRFYLVVPYAEYYRDPFLNIAKRWTTGVGVGYAIVDTHDLEWTLSTGPAYQKTWFVSHLPDEDGAPDAAAWIVSTRFEWDITKDIDFTFDYRGQLTSREVGETTHHTQTTLSTDLTKRISIDISFVWDRISEPKAAADGTVPEKDDYRLVFGFGIDF